MVTGLEIIPAGLAVAAVGAAASAISAGKNIKDLLGTSRSAPAPAPTSAIRRRKDQLRTSGSNSLRESGRASGSETRRPTRRSKRNRINGGAALVAEHRVIEGPNFTETIHTLRSTGGAMAMDAHGNMMATSKSGRRTNTHDAPLLVVNNSHSNNHNNNNTFAAFPAGSKLPDPHGRFRMVHPPVQRGLPSKPPIGQVTGGLGLSAPKPGSDRVLRPRLGK